MLAVDSIVEVFANASEPKRLDQKTAAIILTRVEFAFFRRLERISSR
jgi:hypothetical protein